jgi:hypothetical protein
MRRRRVRADGQHHGNVEVTLVGHDRDGRPVKWMVRLPRVRVPPEFYQQPQADGVEFSLEIGVPASGKHLRSGLLMGRTGAGSAAPALCRQNWASWGFEGNCSVANRDAHEWSCQQSRGSLRRGRQVCISTSHAPTSRERLTLVFVGL